jgi:hypothetical protein
VDLERLASTEPVVGDFMRLVDRARLDPEYRARLAESLAPLFRRRSIPDPEAGRLERWIEEAGRIGLDLLLDSPEGSSR